MDGTDEIDVAEVCFLLRGGTVTDRSEDADGLWRLPSSPTKALNKLQVINKFFNLNNFLNKSDNEM